MLVSFIQHRRNQEPLTVHTAGSYFDHKEVEIIDIHKEEHSDRVNGQSLSSERTNRSLSVKERLINGDTSEKSHQENVSECDRFLILISL